MKKRWLSALLLTFGLLLSGPNEANVWAGQPTEIRFSILNTGIQTQHGSLNFTADFNASISFGDQSIEPNGTVRSPILVKTGSMVIALEFLEAGNTVRYNVSALGRNNYTLPFAQLHTSSNLSLALNGYLTGVLNSTGNGKVANQSFYSAGENYIAQLTAMPDARTGDKINVTLSRIKYILEVEIAENANVSPNLISFNGTCPASVSINGTFRVETPYSWTPIAWIGTATLGSASIAIGVLIFVSRRETLKLEKARATRALNSQTKGIVTPSGKLCSTCSTLNSSNASFCRRCGAKL